MAELGLDTATRDNLVTSTLKLVTDNVYLLGSGNTVVRGTVLKNTAGVLSPCLTSEAPFTIALQDIDASGGNSQINYMVAGTFMESEATYNTGTIGEFRDGLRAVGIVGER